MQMLIRFELREDEKLVAIHETNKPSLLWLLKTYFHFWRLLK